MSFVGCGSDPQGDSLRVDARFIEADPYPALIVDDLFENQTEFDWTFQDPEDLASWRVPENQPTPRFPGQGLAIAEGFDKLDLIRRLDADASSIDWLNLRVPGLTRGSVVLFWAPVDKGFSPKRRVFASKPAGDDDEIRFDLADQPLWQGKIERLRIGLRQAEGDTVRLLSIRAGRKIPKPESWATRIGQALKVDLGGDVRAALPSAPDVPFSRSVDLPPHAVLRFGVGLLPESSAEVTFEARVAEPGGAAEVVFERTLQPGTGMDWETESIDLSRFSKQTVDIELLTTVADAESRTSVFPLWANPEILAPHGGDLPPNIVLISIDTLRADHLSLYGYGPTTSPNIDAWARDSGITFLETVAAAPWTLPSHASMFTGLNALRHGVNRSSAAPPGLLTLAESLRAEGYSTVGFTAGAFLSQEFGLGQGFDRLVVRRSKPDVRGSRDELESGVVQVLEWLEVNDRRPFFLFFHTYEVHSPFWAREGFFEELGGDPAQVPRGFLSTEKSKGDDRPNDHQVRTFVRPEPGGSRVPIDYAPPGLELISKVYDSGIAYMDDQVGLILQRLRELGLDENSVVVLTSDHGEALGEHDLAGHGYLFDDNLMVPMVIALPGGQQGGLRIEQQVRSIDLAPTILDVAGVADPADVDGTSLLPLISGEHSSFPKEAWSYGSSTNQGLSLRYDGRRKFIVRNAAWNHLLGQDLLFDLTQDPGEGSDLASSSEELAGFRQRARQELERETKGLRLEILNGPGSPLAGEVTGDFVKGAAVTSPDLDCNCLEWESPGRARITLPESSSFTVYFEALEEFASGRQLALTIDKENRLSVDLQIDQFDTLSPGEALCWSLDGSQWTDSCAARDSAQAIVRVSLEPGALTSLDQPTRLEDETLEQLKALGYLE